MQGWNSGSLFHFRDQWLENGAVKSLIFAWVLFLRGCYDHENKTREYENISRVFYYNPSKKVKILDCCKDTWQKRKIPVKISDFTLV
jgi:hypothetical protein